MSLEARVAVLETEVQTLSENFAKFQEADLDSKKEILGELKKFNEMVTFGKGGLAVVMTIGCFVIWTWEQVKEIVLKVFFKH